MNARIKSVLASSGAVSRSEEKHTDTVAFFPGHRGVWAFESERRGNAYWIRRNAMRNDRNGAHGIVFVTETIAIEAKVRRIVNSLPITIRGKTLVVAIDNFTREFVQHITEWRS